MKKYSVIVNGNYYHNELEQIYQIQNFFPKEECLDIYVSKSPKENIYNAILGTKTSDFLVVIGGDGTFHEVVRGIIKEGKDVPLLYIPAGTCNDMGKNVGYHSPLKEYIKEAMDNIVEHDIFQFNSEIFCYVAAGGYLMNVPYSVSVKSKKEKKKNAYIDTMLKEFFSTPPKTHMDIRIDGKRLEGEYIAAIFSNTHSIGGCSVYEKKLLNDQRCELMLIKDSSKLKTLLELYQVLKKEKNLDNLSFMEHYQGQNISILMDNKFPHYFCLDGEQSIVNQKKIEVKPFSRVRLMKGIVQK